MDKSTELQEEGMPESHLVYFQGLQNIKSSTVGQTIKHKNKIYTIKGKRQASSPDLGSQGSRDPPYYAQIWPS